MGNKKFGIFSFYSLSAGKNKEASADCGPCRNHASADCGPCRNHASADCGPCRNHASADCGPCRNHLSSYEKSDLNFIKNPIDIAKMSESSLSTLNNKLNTFLQTNPDNLNAMHLKGSVLFYLGRYDQALNIYLKLTQINPNNNLLYCLGHICRELGQHEKALEVFDQILSKSPHETSALNGKGDILLKMGRKQEASKTFQRVLSQEPNNQYAQERAKQAVPKVKLSV